MLHIVRNTQTIKKKQAKVYEKYFVAVDLEIGNEGVAESESRIPKLKKLMM